LSKASDLAGVSFGYYDGNDGAGLGVSVHVTQNDPFDVTDYETCTTTTTAPAGGAGGGNTTASTACIDTLKTTDYLTLHVTLPGYDTSCGACGYSKLVGYRAQFGNIP
jgi:hypothetical protein